MTNFKQVKGNKRRGSNRKDGRPRYQTKAQRNSADTEWAPLGFTRTDWNKRRYTWPGVGFPVFTVSPGILHGSAGLVLTCADSSVKVLEPYGTPPAAIKERLDDLILGLVRQQADVDAPIIDIDEYMSDKEQCNAICN